MPDPKPQPPAATKDGTRRRDYFRFALLRLNAMGAIVCDRRLHRAIWKRAATWGDSDGYFLNWAKNRACELNLFPIGRRLSLDAETARLHVFFLSCEETPEMLERLKKPEIIKDDSPARSKISHTLEVIQPIDRTAMRVSPYQLSIPRSEHDTHT